jgi:hypothetical protein
MNGSSGEFASFCPPVCVATPKSGLRCSLPDDDALGIASGVPTSAPASRAFSGIEHIRFHDMYLCLFGRIP